MIIKKLTLNNFMCYYDLKSFEFANGLNIILGHNGDGKSTIFVAFKWIFDNLSLDLKDVYSKKKYSEILVNESFDVYVELLVTQYNEEYKIQKSFTVTKNLEHASISRIEEKIFRKDLTTGEKDLDRRTISRLSQQVFPKAFRNFSMFETETDALQIVEGEHLADLVKSFSNAKHYEKLDEVIESFAKRADRQFRRESKSEQSAQDAIDIVDKKIDKVKNAIVKLEKRITEDEKGIDFYENKIQSLLSNLKVSDIYKKIEGQIKDLENEVMQKRNENKIRGQFTNNIFEDFYILIGFDKIISQFSDKISKLRQEKNRVDNELRNKYASEKLQLENGSTPFPPGFPSLDILKEILDDDICKICGTRLNSSARSYISDSINLFEKDKKEKKDKKTKIPVIFPNSFIDEMQIIDRSIQLKPEKYYRDRINEGIDFRTKIIQNNTKSIDENLIKIENLEVEKKDLLSKIPNLSEDELLDLRANYEKISKEKDTLVMQIGENRTVLADNIRKLERLESKRNKTLSQFEESGFKKATVQYLSFLSKIAGTVKENEYTKFLSVLSERATVYLQKINVGEITGKIKLYRKNDNEVAFKSLNEDNSMRSNLDDSGALKISKPLSILFAIADIASETADNETYPMIFDAPTGRYSPDREKEFFKVLKDTNKQRIVVTLNFLGADDSNTPYVDTDLFKDIARHKAFFIKRVRPYDVDRPETINTEIMVLN